MTNRTSPPRLIVIGLDGVSFNVLRPMVESGALPNVARLLAAGTHANLRSTVPWQTPVAWTSMATGVNPGGHGVYGWWNPDLRRGELVPASGGQVDRARYWEVLSGAGIPVGVVNVPMSYPARPVNGFHIAGLDCPSSAPEGDPLLAYPRDVLARLAADGAPPYRVMPERIADQSNDEAVGSWSTVELRRIAAVCDLVEVYRPAFLQVNLFVTDYIAHRTRPGDPAREQAYRVADEAIGILLDRYGAEADVLVVSDHGSCPIDRFIMVHNLLRDLGVLTFHPWLADEQVATVLGPTAAPQEVEELLAALHRGGPALRREMYDRHSVDHPGANVGFSTIDWDRTTAFCTSDYGQLRVNRERGAAAVTDPEAERRLLAELTEALLALRCPDTGDRLVAEVLPREQLYRGPHAPAGPDLTPIPVRTDHYFCQVYSFYSGGERRQVAPVADVVDPAATGCAGDHHADGILIASGPRIAPRGAIADASVLDIAPTVLDTFGLPPLPEHEGVVLGDLFGAARGTAAAVAESSTVEEGLRERLMTLGYRI